MCGQALSIPSSGHATMPWTRITPHAVTQCKYERGKRVTSLSQQLDCQFVWREQPLEAIHHLTTWNWKNKQKWQTSLTERTASFVPRPKLHMITSLFPAQCCASCWKYFCSKMSFAAHHNLPTASIALCSQENMTWQLSHHNLLLLTCVTL